MKNLKITFLGLLVLIVYSLNTQAQGTSQHHVESTTHQTAGFFDNESTGVGTNYGVYIENTKTDVSTNYGLYTRAFNDGSGTCYGIYSNIDPLGTATNAYAGYFTTAAGSNITNQYALYATTGSSATNNYAGFFNGRTRVVGGTMEISNDGIGGKGNLQIKETSAATYSRISMYGSELGPDNGDAYWDIAARVADAGGTVTDPVMNFWYHDGTSGTDILTVHGGDARVGVNNTTPITNLSVNSSSSSSISIIDDFDGNYWDIGIGNGSDNFKFAYNAGANFVADIDDASGAYNQLSDKRYKKNEEELSSVLNDIMKLRPLKYHYLANEDTDRKSWGFFAQEVEEVFPDFVSTSNDGNKEQKGIAYDNFAAISMKAIQELNTQVQENAVLKEEIETQNEKIENLESELAEIKSMLVKMNTNMQSCCEVSKTEINSQTIEAAPVNAAKLSQNNPNPFYHKTVINYNIPETAKTVTLQLTTTDGKVVKQYDIDARGYGNTTINGNELPAGTYLYSLVIDGQVSQTKQMVLTK